MRHEQIEIAKDISSKIERKGITKSFIAKATGITISRLSVILSGKETHVSDELLAKIYNFVSAINSDEIQA